MRLIEFYLYKYDLNVQIIEDKIKKSEKINLKQKTASELIPIDEPHLDKLPPSLPLVSS